MRDTSLSGIYRDFTAIAGRRLLNIFDEMEHHPNQELALRFIQQLVQTVSQNRQLFVAQVSSGFLSRKPQEELVAQIVPQIMDSLKTFTSVYNQVFGTEVIVSEASVTQVVALDISQNYQLLAEVEAQRFDMKAICSGSRRGVKLTNHIESVTSFHLVNIETGEDTNQGADFQARIINLKSGDKIVVHSPGACAFFHFAYQDDAVN